MLPVVLVAALFAAAGPLVGQRVLVVPDDGGHADALTAALQARGLDPVPAGERQGVDGVVEDLPRGDRELVRALLGEARARYRALDVAAAVAAAERGFDEALRLERPEDHRDLLVDLLVFAATARLSVGEQDRAARALRLAARLEPERTSLSPALHAPSVVAAWERAVADNAAGADVVVVVRPRVVGAAGEVELVVDGVPRVAEAGLLTLPEGPHLVSLRAAGCRPVSRIVDVLPGVEPLRDALQPVGAAAARARAVAALRAAPDDPTAFAALARLSAADVVISIAPRRAWSSARGVVPVAADPDDVAAFAAAAERALVAPAGSSAPSSPLPPHPQPPSPADPSPILAVALGVGGGLLAVSAVAAGLLLLLPGAPPPPPPRPVVVTCCVQ